MGRTDIAKLEIEAKLEQVFSALIDQSALTKWLPPNGMTATFERFEPWPGGQCRMTLSYLDPAAISGKSTASTDVVDFTFTEIVPNSKVVQSIDFVSEDPTMTGTMTMTWTVATIDGRSLVTVQADDVPPGISADDHMTGMTSSLENLRKYVTT